MIFVGQFDGFVQKICRFLQENLLVFTGKSDNFSTRSITFTCKNY